MSGSEADGTRQFRFLTAGQTMDRSAAIAGGAAVAIAIWIGGRPVQDAPQEPAKAVHTNEPAKLDSAARFARPLMAPGNDRVVATAFPFANSDERQTISDELDWVMPETATPSLALPKKVELPSASATPEPIEQVPPAPSPTSLLQQSPAIQNLPEVSAPAPAVPLRSAPVAAAVVRAETMTAEGLVLAQRGAIFSARAKFLEALRQIAAAQDEANQSTQFTTALRAAVRAMKEAHDFEITGFISQPLDVPRLVTGHRTDLLKSADLADLSPTEARDQYQTYAVEQLVAAIGGESAASMPLYGLGRISAANGKSGAGDPKSLSDAFVWFHAALMADSQNFRAAHELGSLYAQRGEWHQAKTVLQRAAAVYGHPTTWKNLAIVHTKLGETEWATAAAAQAESGVVPPTASPTSPQIQWVDNETFAKSTGPNEVFFPPQGKPPVASAPAPAEPRSAAKPKSFTSWFPWAQRR